LPRRPAAVPAVPVEPVSGATSPEAAPRLLLFHSTQKCPCGVAAVGSPPHFALLCAKRGSRTPALASNPASGGGMAFVGSLSIRAERDAAGITKKGRAVEVFVQQLINGVTLGSIYGLIAIGYTMVFGIIGMVNFAHGDVFMASAFIALITFLILTAWAGVGSVLLALAIVLVVAMALTSLINWTIERL